MPKDTNGPGRKDGKKNVRHTPVNLDTQAAIRRFKADFVSTRVAAEELGLAENTMRKYCQDGCFSNTQVFGGEWVVSRYDVDWWKANRRGKIGRPKAGE
jgi:hypothetical protein